MQPRGHQARGLRIKSGIAQYAFSLTALGRGTKWVMCADPKPTGVVQGLKVLVYKIPFTDYPSFTTTASMLTHHPLHITHGQVGHWVFEGWVRLDNPSIFALILATQCQ